MDVMQMMGSISPIPAAAAKTVASALANNKSTSQARPMDSTQATNGTNSGSNDSSSDSSTITSSDFLTLLVSELKNQDPTQPTDPNAYITQLVGVNSLQQLIGINQGITTLDTSVTGTTTSTATNS